MKNAINNLIKELTSEIHANELAIAAWQEEERQFKKQCKELDLDETPIEGLNFACGENYIMEIILIKLNNILKEEAE